MRGDLAEKAQGIGLVPTFLVLAGEHQRTLGKNVRLFQVASQHLRLPQGKTTDRLEVCSFHCSALLQCLSKEWHSVSDAPAQGVRRAQSFSHPGEPSREVRVLTDAHSPFEQGERPGEVT